MQFYNLSGGRITANSTSLNSHFVSPIIKHQPTIQSLFKRYLHLTLQQMDGKISYINAATAKQIDDELMNTEGEYGWQTEQLMELAGLSIATLAHHMCTSQSSQSKNILVYCGPGNNGGDGLVASRHLQLWGYNCYVVYPKQSNSNLFKGFQKQCTSMGVKIGITKEELLTTNNNSNNNDDDELNKNEKSTPKWDLIIDSLFGYSFKGAVREPFGSLIMEIIKYQEENAIQVLSVDIPSSWDVEAGPHPSFPFHPTALLSLGVPKLCAQFHKNEHWLGGRFMQPSLCEKHGLTLPTYNGSDLITRIS